MDFLLRIFFIIGNGLILKNYLVKKLSSLLLSVLNRNFHHYLSCLKSSLQHHSNAEISPSFLIPVSSIGCNRNLLHAEVALAKLFKLPMSFIFFGIY